MKNLILKQGDLLRVKVPSELTEQFGVLSGLLYEVKTDAHGRLCVDGSTGRLTLTNLDGSLTDACDALTLSMPNRTVSASSLALPVGARPVFQSDTVKNGTIIPF